MTPERAVRPRSLCRRAWVGLVFIGIPLGACTRGGNGKGGQDEEGPAGQPARPSSEPLQSAALGSAIGPPSPLPSPRQGMVWIDGGALVLGTPPSALPRKTDEEMNGEQVILKGYYIDVYPYPNEEGAIPLTNVARDEARALCAARDKRLCSELEWERACKGPDNHVYEYGDKYRPDRCGTGAMPSLRPSGLKVGCRSDFGVRDLHGGAFEWTESPWGRGTTGALFTVRGGNGTAGELVGRCANGEGKPGTTKTGSIGFRCCAGPANDAVVSLRVHRGKPLDRIERSEPKFDSKLARRLLEALPEDPKKALSRGGAPSVDRLWYWHPVGNEELVVASVCSGLRTRPVCGLVIARDEFERATFVAWASSGSMQTTLRMGADARDLWLKGADDQGQYQRLVAYAWGRVEVHGEVRIPKKKKG